MSFFKVEEGFWTVFPTAKIGIVICEGINNHRGETAPYEAMLAAASEEAVKYLSEDFSNSPVVRVWRDAFQKFKTKKGARSSIEALMKRVQNGNGVGPINPLVDIYNAVSLKYALPCGGEDIDTFVGDVLLTEAQGDEPFITLGSEESAPPYPGEIVYKDDGGAICRCWNWRESVRTMLTEETRNAFLCIELVDEARTDALNDALAELAETVKTHLGGTARIEILDADHPSIQIR